MKERCSIPDGITEKFEMIIIENNQAFNNHRFGNRKYSKLCVNTGLEAGARIIDGITENFEMIIIENNQAFKNHRFGNQK
jgi:hypothetical protein